MADKVQRAFRLFRRTLDDGRAAVHHLKGVDGTPQSLDAFMDTAAQRYVVDLQKHHNGGQPFPAVPDDVRLLSPDPAAPSRALRGKLARDDRQLGRRALVVGDRVRLADCPAPPVKVGTSGRVVEVGRRRSERVTVKFRGRVEPILVHPGDLDLEEEK